MNYERPQLQVFQEFLANVPLRLLPLRAVLVGPHAFYRRHSVATDRLAAALGAYPPDAGLTALWPGRPAGAKVDPAYTRVFIDKARLLTFTDTVGGGATIAPVAGKPNRIRATGLYGFKANGTSFPRFPSLYSRDVKPGDIVTITGTDSEDETDTLTTYVKAIRADQTSSVVGAATPGSTNYADQAGGVSIAQVAGTDNDASIQASVGSYAPLASGVIDETYTVTVIQSSTGTDVTTARIRVTSASGLDDDPVITPAAAGTPFNVGNRGLQILFPTSDPAYDLIVGQAWTIRAVVDYEHVTASSAGTYTGDTSMTYVVEFIKGGFLGESDDDDKPQFKVTTTTGTDVGGPVLVGAGNAAYPVGTKGVTIGSFAADYGIAKGEKFTIAVTAASDGRFSVLELGHALSPILRDTTDLDLTIEIERDVEIPRLAADGTTINWTQSATEIVLTSGLTTTDPEIVSSGLPVALDITSGAVSVEYLAWRSDLAGEVRALAASDSLDSAVSGPLTPANRLKYGLQKALANANTTEVLYVAVEDPADVDSWSRALGLLSERDDLHGVVVLSDDRTVQGLAAAHATSLSGPLKSRWRSAWVSTPMPSIVPVATPALASDSGMLLASITDDPDTSGSQYTIVTLASGNFGFIAGGVRPGDTLRTAYTLAAGKTVYVEYTVDAVIAEDMLRLLAGPGAATVAPQRIEIWRTLTSPEIAEQVAALSGAFGSSRVRNIVPAGKLTADGVEVPGYFLAAALAAYRSGILPQAGLTNSTVTGFTGVSNAATKFSEVDIDAMAAGGTWLVKQLPSGSIVTSHAVTTLPSAQVINLAEREESMIANLDAISYVYYAKFAPLIGRVNVTPATVAAFRTDLQQVTDMLKSNGASSLIGSSLIDGVIVRCEQDLVQRDAINIQIDVTLPAPFNYGRIHLVVQ